ncbi:peptide deformylase, mitochondrial-like [Arctopsyche grandis]|uniref:peptide deformylase, mitochondrial-like n=1 Tax=Arctopsyche grandis TaxID=121162 RepID=UPI00406D8E4A
MHSPIRTLLNWYSRISPKKAPNPPHSHVVQLGDPILRQIAKPLPLHDIKSNQTKKLINSLKDVMQSYNSIGISAPQIGISKRIIILEFHLGHKELNTKYFEEKEMSIFPHTVIINPVVRPITHKKVISEESCESFRGFTAKVPRYHEIQLTGYNENANEIKLNLSGWMARVAQHELDHLDAKVFTDIMIKESLYCMCWKEVNEYSGKITLPFRP